MDRRQIPLAGADEGRAPVMTMAMFHEVRDAQDRVAARLIRERVARDPLAAWHNLQQSFGLAGMGL